MMIGIPTLQVKDLEVRYQDAVGVQGISLEAYPGEIVAVLGANGAGKTTTMRAIAGFVPGDRARISAGQVLVDGRSVAGMSPDRITTLRVALVPERNKVFGDLTVWQNLTVVGTAKAVRPEQLEQVVELFPFIGARRKQFAGSLSGGERQMLAVARALLLDPKVLLIDELSFGLAPIIIDEIVEKLLTLSTGDRSIVVVEQSAAVAQAVAKRAYLLNAGRMVSHGLIHDLLESNRAELAYLGGEE